MEDFQEKVDGLDITEFPVERIGLLCEVCVDSVESAKEAEKGGAQRVELCASLIEGGITPSAGMVARVRKSIKIGLNVIIRPRAADFCYSEDEFEVMRGDIAIAKELGADGVVFGILNPDGVVDMTRNQELVKLSRPMKVTFHRAFDMTIDAFQALEDIISLGFDRILTSGQESSCLEGLDLLSELVRRAGDRIIIMPGGGITERNIKKIMNSSKAKEFHVSGRVSKESVMRYRNTNCFMGGALRNPEFFLSIVSSSKISNFRKEVMALHSTDLPSLS